MVKQGQGKKRMTLNQIFKEAEKALDLWRHNGVKDE